MVRTELVARGMCLSGLVNNAGIAVAGPLEEVPLDRLREVLSVNVVGVIAVSQAFLPLLRAGHGRIVNVSSISGRVAAPLLGPYAASKFALEALSDALRLELRPWGLAVVLIEPGPIATPIWAKGKAAALVDRQDLASDSLYIGRASRLEAFARQANERGLPPERVAEVISRALSVPRPRARYLVARNGLAVALLARLVPDNLRDLLLSRRW
jgi:NAD(P)-dependent dehydrogenase (short-subunit alcohol dehydrogenase family)